MKIYNRFLLASALLASVISCRKQDHPVIPNQTEQLTVATAQFYFENQVKRTAVRSERTILPFGDPLWDSAHDKSLNIGDAIAVPLKMESYIQWQTEEKIPGDNYLLVYKKQDGSLRHEVVTVIPASAHESAATFNGMVIIRDWSGSILRGFNYKSGKYESAAIKIGGQRSAGAEKFAPCQEPSVTVCIRWENGMGIDCTWGIPVSGCGAGGGDFPSGGGSWGGEPGGGNPDPGNYPTGGPGSGGSNTGNETLNGQIIKTELANPCLTTSYNAIYNSKDLSNWISKVIKDIFGGVNSDVDLTFREKPASFFTERTVMGAYNRTESFIRDHVNKTTGQITKVGQVYIDLNVDSLPKASKEYITAVIFHESLHAYLAVQGIVFDRDYRNQHETMAAAYTDRLADAVREVHPYLTTDQAKVLSWSGLQETISWSSKMIRDQMENDYKFATFMRPVLGHQDGTLGTPSGCK